MQITDVQRAMRSCAPSFAFILVISIVINILALASPVYMLQLYDRVLSSRSIDTLVLLTIIVVAALGLLSILDGLRRSMLGRLGVWFDQRLAPQVLQSALAATLRGEKGRAYSAPADLASLRQFMGGPTIAPLLDAPFSPLFLGILFLLHPLLGFIGLGSAVWLLCLALINEAITRRPIQDAGIGLSDNQQLTQGILRNAEVIRAMGMMQGVLSQWHQRKSSTELALTLAEQRGTLILSISRFSRLAVQTLIMGAGAWLVIQENASAGIIFASSFLLSRALAPVDNAIGSWRSCVSARLAYRRLVELFRFAPPESKGMPLPAPRGWLGVEDLTYTPPGCVEPTLRGINCNLAAGEVLAVMGPSAAGKSTLARLIAGTALPTSGHVRLDGADIDIWHRSGGSRHIGYLPQDVELFDGSVGANIARFEDASPETIIAAAQLVGLHETIMRMPKGYDTNIGEAGLRLSGGMRQRVGLARAVFNTPRLLVLDEPNASLDHLGEEALSEALRHLKALGTTIVVATHRPALLNLADKLLLMSNGCVDVSGRREEVIARIKAAQRDPRSTGPQMLARTA